MLVCRFSSFALDALPLDRRVGAMIGPVWLPVLRFTAIIAAAFTLTSCTSNPPSAPVSRPTSPKAEIPQHPIRVPPTASSGSSSPAFQKVEGGVMLGIDVLAAENFAPIAGKRVGLFTHPAGVNRFGVSTIDVLRRAPNVKLVALFGPEHGIHGDIAAGKNFPDTIDKRTGLPAFSSYSAPDKKPTKAQLHKIDVMVVDLQDIGVRSYTYATLMRYTIEACFENGVEVVVLDRPNPLGGLKVDGPMLDRELMSGVGGFRVPYVHGLTIGELARFAVGTPDGLNISEAARARGKLVVIPMRGWHRSMRWPETGLTFVPTSPYVPDFPACVGYAMTGLGCQIGGFTHGIGTQYPFRGLFYTGKSVDSIQHELEALKIPGLSFRKVSTTKANGQSALGVYVDVSDWDDWRPTELNFYLMQLNCKFSGPNGLSHLKPEEILMFNKLTGSMDLWKALKRDGARFDLKGFLALWQREDAAFQQASRKFWLYQ